MPLSVATTHEAFTPRRQQPPLCLSFVQACKPALEWPSCSCGPVLHYVACESFAVSCIEWL